MQHNLEKRSSTPSSAPLSVLI